MSCAHRLCATEQTDSVLQCPPLLTAAKSPSAGVTKPSPKAGEMGPVLASGAPSARLPWVQHSTCTDQLGQQLACRWIRKKTLSAVT